MSQKLPGEAERFKSNFDDLFNLIYDLCEECVSKGYEKINLTYVEMACNYVENKAASETIEDFIFYSCRYWSNAKTKSVDFFEENLSDIFTGIFPISKKHLELFEILHIEDEQGEKYLSDEDIEDVWDYIHSCIKISIKYLINNPEVYEIIKVKLASSSDKFVLDLEKVRKEWNL